MRTPITKHTRMLAVAALAASLQLLTAWPACAGSFTFAAIGDMPYGTDSQFIDLIDSLNREPLAFTVHVGDIKSGSSVCSDQTFRKVLDMFNRFDKPLIYTPGDNEWTDCHRRSNGAMDPLERLEKIRSMFFPTAMSLGRHPVRLEVQADAAEFRSFVENRIWTGEGVTFATLHIVGSNNNRRRDMKPDDEFYRRDAANRQWLAQAFSRAKSRNDSAVVLAMQADTTYPGNMSEDSGFRPWLEALANEARAWGKPVLLIQGDSHSFKLDRPFSEAGPIPMPNVTRIVVPGASHVAAVLVTVDSAQTEAPFTIRVLEPFEDPGRKLLPY